MQAHAAAAIFACVLVSGCQGGGPSLTSDEAPKAISMRAETAIAGDMASRFVEAMGSEKPRSVSLSPAAGQSAEALENALRLFGYAVVGKDEQALTKTPAVQVTYGATAFEDVVLVHLSTPALTLTRAYRTSAEGAQPATPLAVSRHR